MMNVTMIRRKVSVIDNGRIMIQSVERRTVDVSPRVIITNSTFVHQDETYVHVQNVASDTWSITHNLGKKPAITVMDNNGYEWDVSVQHLSINAAIVSLLTPMTGTATCN